MQLHGSCDVFMCVHVPAVSEWQRSDTGSPFLRTGKMAEEPGCRTDPKHTVLPSPPQSPTWSLSDGHRNMNKSITQEHTYVIIHQEHGYFMCTNLRKLRRCLINKLFLWPHSRPWTNLSVDQSEQRYSLTCSGLHDDIIEQVSQKLPAL